MELDTVTEQAAPSDRTLPLPRPCPFSPPPEYAEMREQEPVARVRLPSGDEAWALTSYADIRAMLTDERFSSDNSKPGDPFFTKEKPSDQPIQLLINMDP